MTLKVILSEKGEHQIILQGPVGKIDSVITMPDNGHKKLFAVLGHPHSLQGGTMTNKVVTTLARTFRTLDIPSIRFNFRGVGQTEGTFDNGVGESEDMLSVVSQIKAVIPDVEFIFAGFSFGSYVTYRAAAQHPHKILVTVAPPFERFDYEAFSPAPSPWVIIQGLEDEVVDSENVLHFAKQQSPELHVLKFEEAGHFFHGRLVELKNRLVDMLQDQV